MPRKETGPMNERVKFIARHRKVIIALRKHYPCWGPKKLKVVLARRNPNMKVPATSTVGDILKKSGLIKKRRRKRYNDRHGTPLQSFDRPNVNHYSMIRLDGRTGRKSVVKV